MKKRRIIVTSLAVILAVTLAFGGTIAYLTGSSGEVKNEFNKNQNGVELDETTGSEYEIVPGTSQDKDPTITATYTLDSYVFVEVTDATEDLVTWYIANGWTLLSTANNADGSTTYVYYMLLETEDASSWTEVTSADASSYEDGDNHIGEYVYVDSDGVTYYYDSNDDEYTAIIHVLEGDKVYYDSSITNADIDSAGDISLTFQAYIIQAEPFLGGNNNDVALGAEAAYLALLNDSTAYAAAGYAAMVNGKLYTDLSSAMTAALSAGTATTVDVVADSEISDTLLLTVSNGETANITLNLNGNSITYDDSTASSTTTTYSSLIRVGEGVTLTITGDGTIDGTGMDEGCELIWARGGTVIIENGTFISQTTMEACVYASTPNGGTSVGTVEIYGGTFQNTASGSYAYGSNLSPLTLNVWNGEGGTGYNDSGVSSGDITVYGGTFYGNNPASGDDNLSTKTASDTQRAVTTFVADGYSVETVTTSSGNAYVVYKENEPVTITGLSLSEALTATASISSSDVTIELDEGEYSLTDTTTEIPEGTTIIGSGTDETVLTVDCNGGDGYTISSENVTLSNLTISCTNMGTSYGNSAINVTESGTVLDNVVITGGTKSTYTASIYINGGSDPDFTFTIKNSTIDNSSQSPFRGLFVEGLAGTLYIDNCTIDSVYPMNIMSASTTAEVYFTNSTLHGWTSYTSNVSKVTFTNCTLSKGSGKNTYDNVAAYADTVFDSCTFDDSLVLYAQTSGFSWTFTDCTKGGTAVTADNFKTLFPDDSDVWNECTCTVNGTSVGAD